MNDRAKNPPPTAEEPFASAHYEGKEAWKNQPGHRYTPAELRAMGSDFKLTLRPARNRIVRKA